MRKYFQAVLAGNLIVWLLYSCFLAANPELHHALHHDAGQSSHHCAVTLLEKQQVHTSDPLVQSVRFSPALDKEFSLPVSAVLTSTDCRLAPGRAPPV